MVDDPEEILSVTLFGVQLPPNEIITTVVMVFWGDVNPKFKNHSSINIVL